MRSPRRFPSKLILSKRASARAEAVYFLRRFLQLGVSCHWRTSMKNSVPCVMVIGTLLLLGCGSKNDANERNLSDATNAYLVKKGQLCLGLAAKWPVDLQDSDRGAGSVKGSEMAALEKAGLVRSQEASVEITPLSGTRPVKSKVLRYELTDDGKKFYQEKEVPGLIGQK